MFIEVNFQEVLKKDLEANPECKEYAEELNKKYELLKEKKMKENNKF